ncbi:MAG: c(7)-type cytochrome triheme domain-containing protein, partial [Rhodothermales bacterium]
CHPRIFRYRGTEIKMADVLQGNYCGECHGKVAFPPPTACERCHVDLPQAPNRAQPLLLGTIQMKRVALTGEDDSTLVALPAGGDSLNTQDVLYSTASLPRATFPHWVHRIRFKCKVCHTEIFEPEAGANEVTMKDIGAGKFCGRCHNDKVAFGAGFSACDRCHISTNAASN